jgi:beta-glucosidase
VSEVRGATGEVLTFPEGFVWGTAMSAYQVEGATREDGRGESIWDTFARTPGRIADGSTGDVACDHYHRWREDVEIMAQLGLGAYRFSIAWPRVMPAGRGRVSGPGLAFYDRLVDGLLERGIVPLPTLFHWDLPQPLADAGGWLARDTAGRFADYAAVCFDRLGDRVATWLTINEPQVAAIHGHHTGVHAPGMRDLGAAVRAAHHLLLGHGMAVATYRSRGFGGRIGIPLNLWPHEPAGASDADRVAAAAADGHVNRWYLDPILRGVYPADVRATYEERAGPMDWIAPGDAEVIGSPIDLLGVNYYSRSLVRAGEANGLPWRVLAPAPGAPVTEMGWEVSPEALTALLRRLHAEYRVPLIVSENGAAYADAVGPDGRVEDPLRVRYLRDHLAATHAAIAAGVPVEGYLAWSLLDNFEWAEGYTKRFGLVHVDYATQRRTVKASGRAYAKIVAANALAD